MNKDQAREYIKGELENYLTSSGRSTRRPFRCANPEHPDTKPSMSFDKKRLKVHCFSCGADYDTLDLIGIDNGITDPAEIFKKAYEIYGITGSDPLRSSPIPAAQKAPPKPQHEEQPEPDYTALFEEAHKAVKETDYPQRRGLSEAIINRFNLGYIKEWRHPKAPGSVPATPRLIIPTSESSYLARDTRAKIEANQLQYKSEKVGKVRIFNREALKDAKKPVFIVEGEIDAMSIIEMGGEAIATGSTANTPALLKLLEAQRPSQPLIIAMDNDNAGGKAARELAEGLERLHIPFYRAEPYGEYKDANERLQKDKEGLRAAIMEAEQTDREAIEAKREAYKKNSAAEQLQGFINGITESINTPYIPTGFNNLDRVLEGGLYEGLYILGAISSLGKTTFITQIADQIAQRGTDVLIISLEMARAELIAKSISRHTIIETITTGGNTKNAKTTRGITTGKRYANYNPAEIGLIKSAINKYKEYAQHIYIVEGVGDIGAAGVREKVEQHILYTGNTPVVIIDYLQILAPYNDRATDKQNTDKAVLELKRLSRDYKLPVIGISSFNRDNYSAPVNQASFKESGAIEYSSDVLIGLQYEDMDYREGETDGKTRDMRIRELFKQAEADGKNGKAQSIQVKILKNRNGSKGDSINYSYYPIFNYFKEA